VISGSALLVDYVLTITTSIAGAGDALFSFLPANWIHYKLAFEAATIVGLIVLNLRGVKESVIFLAPIFVVFVITHVVAILGGVIGHVPELPTTVTSVQTGFHTGSSGIGWAAMMLLLVHAYSLGGGTYTGIEAVSNGLPIMREPKVQTAKKTMVYMAASLAFTASGLLLCYLLWKVQPVDGKTLNAVLFEKMTANVSGGSVFVIVALFAEGLLLIVAAQTGFIDGPRVLANMAVDSWLPRRFAALSDRLTTGNGVLLMGGAALAALFYTDGDISHLLVMYSINVFLTFSLSIFGMLKHYIQERKRKEHWKRATALFTIGFLFCATILAITISEKFMHGGWVTLMITAMLVSLCFWVKSHYVDVAVKLRHLHVDLKELFVPQPPKSEIDTEARTAVLLVGSYGNLGLQTIKNILTTFPGVYKNIVFVSVAVIDSGVFKGEEQMEHLKTETEAHLKRYQDLALKLGLGSTARYAVGTEIAQTGTALCSQVKQEFPNSTFFTGKLIFEKESWSHRLLHNETAFGLQKNLQWAGMTMVILPIKIA
jgi:amino acid transporter